MKKLIYLIGVMSVLTVLSAQASTLNEWNFYSDPAGKTLSNAVNSAGIARFSAGGTGVLETDGNGTLLCTSADPSTNGIWTNGVILDAATSNLTTGTFFLRYDFKYDLNSTNNNSGTLLGFAFTDSTGAKVAGAALQYDLGSTPAPTNLVITQLADLGSNLVGHVSIITKVDMTAQKLAVWYDLSGTGSFSAESSPQASNITVNLPSINKLRLQATGDFRPAGSDDSANISLLRMSDSFSDAASSAPILPAAKYSNEWTFERDISGRPLSDTINSGTNIPLAQFSTGFSNTVFTTNRALICVGNDAGTDGVWTNGTILNAALPSATSGVHYLRYDLNYDLSSTNNDSGTLMGVYFTGATGDKAAGLVLGYDVGNMASATPTNRTLTSVTNGLPLSGTLTAIAEVNLDTHILRVWYDLSGSNTFNTNSPSISTNITLSSITNLRFHATGDFRPSGSSNYVSVDNIRHTASLSEILDPPANLTAAPNLTISVSNSLNGAMETGETNIISVVIHNSGGPATDVTSALAHNGMPASFTVISNNLPVPLEPNSSTTNTYALIASSNGTYSLTIQAFSTETNSTATNLILRVGSHVSYVGNSIVEIGPGVVSNRYEPGETIRITITNRNDGARTVTNIVNTLSANSSYFTIFPASATYPSLAVGSSTSTVYAVVISNATPPGTYTFSVTNRAGSTIWSDTFALNVFQASIPSATSTSLVIQVASGATGTGNVTLTNSGNAQASFTVTDNGLPAGSYTVETQGVDRVVFLPAQFDPETVFTNWTGSLDIGFTMPVFGARYSSFSVSRFGTLTLSSTNGATATLNVFQSTTAVDTNSIRFLKETNRLVVAWGNGTDREFQAWINSDGTIQYLYQYGTWGSGTIGLSDALHSQTLSHTPGLTGRDSLLLTPASWVAYAPVNGTVGAQNGQILTFTANAAGQPNGTNTFDAIVDWGNGSNSVIHVSVIVEAATQNLQILLPIPFSFQGPAGFITRTNMVVTNSGNAALSYTITDGGVQAAGYTATNVTYGWQHIPQVASYILSPSQLDTTSLNIGFPFVFFGNVYTALTVNANGTISLGSGATISPFAANLSLDSDSSVRFLPDSGFNQFTVTWENIAQSNGGSNQTFQAILDRNGLIRFNYQQLGKGWTNGVIQLADSSGTVNGTLSNAATTATSVTTTPVYSNEVIKIGNATFTNQVKIGETTNIVTTYTDTANLQSLQFIPGKQRIISASPVSGTIPALTSTNIIITGDARSLQSGGLNQVTNSTTLVFHYSGKSTNALVTFTATNSADTAYPAFSSEIAESMWGADPVVTSQLNIDGSRTVSWPAANDSLTRTYKVWYTLDLMQDFQLLATVSNGTSYVDTEHNDAPVIYYKVTVQ